MGKIGKLDYPDMNIDEALKFAKVLEEEFTGHAPNIAVYAERLGYSAKSGTFFKKIADLRKYRLIESRGDIKSTELTKRIIHHGDPDAYRDLVLGIPLINDLYRKLGSHTPGNNFWVIVAEVAKCEPQEAKNQADKIAKFYIEAIGKISNMKGSSMQLPVGSQSEVPPQTSKDTISANIGDVKVTMPRTQNALETLKAMIPLLKQQIDTEDKKENQTTK